MDPTLRGTDRSQRWGIPQERRNRVPVRVLLRLLRSRPVGLGRPERSARRWLRDAIGLLLSSDVRSPHLGDGLYLPHPWGVVVHARARIGERVTIFQHATIGEDTSRPGVPTIGDDVVIGAGAVILGPVTVGDGARIGANAVVLGDVPPGAVAVGVPARVVAPRGVERRVDGTVTPE